MAKIRKNLRKKTYAEITPKAKPDPVDFREISTVDSSFYGRLQRYNPDELVGKKGLAIYRKMAVDEQIKAAIYTKIFAVLSSGWEIQAPEIPEEEKEAGDELVEFVKWNFEEMEGHFDSKLQEMLTALIYGYAVGEKVFYLIDFGKFAGKIGQKDIKFRRPESIDFEADEYGNLLENGVVQTGKMLPRDKFLIYSYRKQFSNYYGQSDLREAYRCFSSDTEILTIEGWKSIQAVTKADQLATLNPGTDCLEYHKPRRVYCYPYRGKMFHQGGRFVDMLTTPNHRMWAAPRHEGSKFRFIEASNLTRRYRIKRDAGWIGKEEKLFVLSAVAYGQTVRTVNGPTWYAREFPAKQIPMDSWLKLFGIWLAKGHTWRRKDGNRQCVVGITQNVGPLLERIKSWITECGFSYYAHKGSLGKSAMTLEISSVQLYEYMRQFGKSHEKYIPIELKTLSPRQLSILYEAMMAEDGSHRSYGTDQYASVSRRLADDVSEIILKMGSAPTISVDKSPLRYGHKPVYLVSKNTRKISRTLLNEHVDKREWVDYDGTVYCVEVPNHIVYVRRNGKACWSGNSWWLKDTQLKYMNIGLERYGEPVADISHEGTITPAQRTKLENFAKNVQSRSGLVHDKKITLDFKSPTFRADMFITAINLYDTHLRIAILMPGLMGMAAEQQVGSLARSGTEFNVFLWIINQLRLDLETVINEQDVKPLVDLNYEVTGGQYPKFKFREVDAAKEAEIYQMWLAGLNVGALKKFPEDENKMRGTLGLAEKTDEELAPEPLPESPGIFPPEEGGEETPPEGEFLFQNKAGHIYQRNFDDEAELIEFIQSLQEIA